MTRPIIKGKIYSDIQGTKNTHFPFLYKINLFVLITIFLHLISFFIQEILMYIHMYISTLSVESAENIKGTAVTSRNFFTHVLRKSFSRQILYKI